MIPKRRVYTVVVAQLAVFPPVVVESRWTLRPPLKPHPDHKHRTQHGKKSRKKAETDLLLRTENRGNIA